MKYTIETKDTKEAMRLIKSLDMAVVLFDFLYNSRKECYNRCESEQQSEGVDIAFEKFGQLLNERDIIIDEIIE
jgi:hypothetical protein